MARRQSEVSQDDDLSTSGHNISASSRPTSSYTIHSSFADSAVDMHATTPMESPESLLKPEVELLEPLPSLTPGDIDQTVSDKMRQLAAVAWAMEQDDGMTVQRQRMLHTMSEGLESHLDSMQEEVVDRSPSQHWPVSLEGASEDEEDDVWIEESDLIKVHESLTATVQAMRMRHEEQRHLQQLTAQKLEAMAQRCLDQDARVQDLLRDLHDFRAEIDRVGQENDTLREKLASIQEEASHNGAAVEAMSSAVNGLEGWIESTHPSEIQPLMPLVKTKRQKVVIRGKGRFRGRYFVDEDGDEAVAYSLTDAASESQELHDGVKAWLRGFRDVEEELRHHESPTKTRPQGRFRVLDHHSNDERADFQSGATPE